MKVLKMNQTPEKTAWEIMDEVEQATIELDQLPTLIQLLIERYKLDQLELTKSEKRDLGEAHKEINDVLTLLQWRLFEMQDKLKAIQTKKDLDSDKR